MKRAKIFLLTIICFIFALTVGACSTPRQESASTSTSSGKVSFSSLKTSKPSTKSSEVSSQTSIKSTQTSTSTSSSNTVTSSSISSETSISSSQTSIKSTQTSTSTSSSNTVTSSSISSETSISSSQTSSSSIVSSSSSQTSSSQKQAYLVEVDLNVEGGKVEVDKQTAYSGEQINLTYEANKGYTFVKYVVMQGQTEISVAENSFIMPSGKVNVSAIFIKINFDIKVETSIGGEISISKETATYGEEISLSNTPSEGYKFVSYSVASGTDTIEVINDKFIMPLADVEVRATFIKQTYLVTITVNDSEWGSVNCTSLTVEHGTSISTNGETLTVGSNSITALATAQTEQYIYVFKDWSFASSVITGETIITANFIRQEKTYLVTLTQPTGGSIKIDDSTTETREVKYGTSITLTNIASEGYLFSSYKINGETQTENTFTMPAGNVTVTGSFSKIAYTITVTQVTGGTIKTSKTSANYQDSITLSNTPTAGYVFGSYVVKTGSTNVSVSSSKFTMPAGNVTVTGSFNAGIGGLSSFSYSNIANYNSSKTGTLTVNGGSISSSQNYYPSVTSWVRGNFYYETEVALYSDRIYNGDLYCKTGIVISSAQNIIFAPIDAYVNGVNNAGFGSKTELIYCVGRGTLNNGISWSFFGNADYKGNFGKTYGNADTYIKLGVMRIDGVYKFFANDKFMFSVWQPDATSSIQVGILSLNLGFEAKNTKIGYGESVINNANAYYGIKSNLNPTTRTIDGKVDGKAVNDSGAEVDYSWKENLVNSYGVGDYTRYTYSSAFKGTDGVYVATRSRTKNYRTEYSNVWENTNVEIRGKSGTNSQIRVFFAANGVCGIADNNGTMTSTSGFKQGWTKYQDADGYYVITLEGFIPYSAFGSNVNASSTIKMTFAFRSEEIGLNMQDGTDGVYWCGFGSPSLEVTTNGLNMQKETTPTEKNIKPGIDGADPFVLAYDNKYYTYATNAGSVGYKVYVSDDLYTWRVATEQDFIDVGVTTPNEEMVAGYAMHKNWSKSVYFSKSGDTITCKNLWAPEVAYNPKTKKFVMTYSGYMEGDLAVVSVATSDSPLGPFVDVYGGEKGFLAPAGDASKASIDASIFVDTDGKAYLYYCNDCTRNRIDNFKNSGVSWGVSETWVVALDETWTKTTGTHTKCITPTQTWETQNDSRSPNTAWNEGPYVYKYNGVYYMTYSANPFWNEYYGVGLAFAKSPLGPWTKYHANPIVSKVAGKSVATGHNMFFKDFNGKLWCAYHTYSDPNSTTNGGRELLLSRAWFDSGILRVEYHNW